MLKPTKEQEEIIRASHTNKMLKINAAAGAGKTSSLMLLANAHQEDSLYIAFNKAIADEAKAKFPSHVECRTTHSLAFAKYGRELMHKLSRPNIGYVNVAGTAAEIAKYYGLEPIHTFEEDEDDIKENTLGFLVKDTVRRYEQSSSDVIERKHVSKNHLADLRKGRPTMDVDAVVSIVLQYANKLWQDRTDIHSRVLATHDTYLKLFQLSKPVLDYSIIYLDEGQDTGDTVLDIVLNQRAHAKIIVVGDTYQSIYSWRGAVNAMEKITSPTRYLTKSFRYGQAVADVATAIIGGEMIVKGNDSVESSIVNEDELETPYTKLYRTNGTLIGDAIGYIREGWNVSCEVDTRDYKKLLDSTVALHSGNSKAVKHDDIVPYSTWADLVEASQEDPALKNLVKTMESGFINIILQHLPAMKRKDDADITLITAHKSKGREWDNVSLANDYPSLNDKGKLAEQERNLLYVASTRAIKKLSINNTVMEMVELYVV